MLRFDERTQCQVLERTQPAIPLGMGHVGTKTNDYIRHGTTGLSAAMSCLEGKLLYRTEQRHPHVKWLRFLKQLHREMPRGVEVRVIADNHANVKVWLNKHRRFHMHFTPTSNSWMTLVERFFADLTEDCVRDGSFARVKDLKDSILACLEQRNRASKPCHWKARGAAILAKIRRVRQALPQGES